MAKTYITKAGDMWDLIAYTEMGSASFQDVLMMANQRWIWYYILPGGIRLNVPEVEEPKDDSLPPWKRGGTE